MSENITQVAKKGALGNTFVGEVHNHNEGITPLEASELAINLFMENFPKLQAEAYELVNERANEFADAVIKKLEENGITNFSAFKDPDMQYVLFESQKNYARFGSKDLLEILSSIITERVMRNEEDIILKATIDKASSIASMLTPDQLDLLSLMFTCTEVKYGDIKDIESLERKLVYLSSVFSKANRKDIPYLKMMECLDLKLPNVIKIQSEAYGFNENDVEKICPELVKSLRNDYGVSYVGIILGIVNAHNKTNMRFDPRIWIK